MTDEQTTVETEPVLDEPRKRMGRPPKVRPEEPEVSQYILRTELVAWLREQAQIPMPSNRSLPRIYQSLAAQLEKGVVP